MKKQRNKKPVVVVIDEILDCIPADVMDLEAYFLELERSETPQAT